jgi:hypothetical protein
VPAAPVIPTTQPATVVNPSTPPVTAPASPGVTTPPVTTPTVPPVTVPPPNTGTPVDTLLDPLTQTVNKLLGVL